MVSQIWLQEWHKRGTGKQSLLYSQVLGKQSQCMPSGGHCKVSTKEYAQPSHREMKRRWKRGEEGEGGRREKWGGRDTLLNCLYRYQDVIHKQKA